MSFILILDFEYYWCLSYSEFSSLHHLYSIFFIYLILQTQNIVDAKRAFNHSFCLRTSAEPDLEDNSGCNQSNEASTMIQSRVLSLFKIVPSIKEDMLEKGRWNMTRWNDQNWSLPSTWLYLLPYWVLQLQSASIELNKIEAVSVPKKNMC